jgi:Xaa-Pro aminopeptidase
MGLDGFLVPRADVHQGEYVAARDERLQWLTGFTGSAGFCIVLPEVAGVFIDGRYRTQVKAQVDPGSFTPVPWPEVKPGDWVKEKLASGRVGFDPWLHTADEMERLERSLEGTGVTLVAVSENPVDAIWPDQPAAPFGKAFVHPLELAGESHAEKRARLAEGLRKAGQKAAVVTLPDSLCWLLNIRGADVPKNPVVHGFAVLQDDGRVDLFVNPAKYDDSGAGASGGRGCGASGGGFAAGACRADGAGPGGQGDGSAGGVGPVAGAGVEVSWGDDPCRLPKACKNPAEIAATREAHLRDGAAMVEFLRWLDEALPQRRADRDFGGAGAGRLPARDECAA